MYQLVGACCQAHSTHVSGGNTASNTSSIILILAGAGNKQAAEWMHNHLEALLAAHIHHRLQNGYMHIMPCTLCMDDVTT